MPYYVIEIATGDKSIAGYGVYKKDTKKEAWALFLHKHSTAMNSPLYESSLLILTDAKGEGFKIEYYDAAEWAEPADQDK